VGILSVRRAIGAANAEGLVGEVLSANVMGWELFSDPGNASAGLVDMFKGVVCRVTITVSA